MTTVSDFFAGVGFILRVLLYMVAFPLTMFVCLGRSLRGADPKLDPWDEPLGFLWAFLAAIGVGLGFLHGVLL